MKVLIVDNMAPFVWGGAEELAHHLRKNLIIAGHEAQILRIPFKWEPAISIPSQMLMVRAFELYNVDHVIALKFPAYLIRHANKTFMESASENKFRTQEIGSAAKALWLKLGINWPQTVETLLQ